MNPTSPINPRTEGGRGIVLLVEDNPAARSVVREWLRQHGFTVLEAEGGRSALALLRTASVKLIITDVIMPEGDGIELLQWLRERHTGIPVIAMSAGGGRLAADFVLKMTRALGATAILPKPFSGLDLELAIAGALGAGEPESHCQS